jgi:aminopeptidase N
MPKSRLILIILALTACNVSSVEPTQSNALSEPTVALPPAFTPTPSPIPSPTLPATPVSTDGDNSRQRQAMLPEFAGDIDLVTDATQYEIQMSIKFDPQIQEASIEGTARIHVKNPTNDALEELVLRLWPNHQQYLSEMEIGKALIDGEVVEPSVFQGGTAVRYVLPHAWSADSWLDITVTYGITAAGPIGGNIPRRFGISRGVFFAPTAYPIVPRFINGDWEIDPARGAGDTTNSDTSFYYVSITAPRDLELAASGSIIAQAERGEVQLVEIATGPVRDFAFALGALSLLEREVDGTNLRTWVISDHVDDAERMLSAAAAQFQLLNDLVGPYPYRELDIVDLAGVFGGIEYPGLVTIGTVGTPFLIRPVVHEVAHQWFYGLIGDDQLLEPWLDEAAATYFEIRYFEEVQGSGAAAGIINNHRAQLGSHPDPEIPIGKAVEDYLPNEYGLFVYLKGALFFDALRAELGEDLFQTFLHEYFLAFRYGFASTAGFQNSAETVCACSLQVLFDTWIYEGGEIPGIP